MAIHILSNDIIDQIAAGEVVERPAHMVKELVENSIDAGATRVEVEYSQGGRWVRVKDNGAGIAKDELSLALARHATSKISASEDLWRLHSFGFRGEALASISAVSKLTIISKQADSSVAHQLNCEFGKLSSVEESGGEKGTQIYIEELFANVPARLKFLKSEAAEGIQIKNAVKALALSHPEVEFHLSQGTKLIFYWPSASSRRERAQQILEIEDLYEGEAEKDGIKAYALFTDPNTTTKTSKNIWLFAQSRSIQDRSLQTAVMDGFRNLLMHGEYPSAVVWVETDPEEVDVNIHPTKSQVKFRDPQSAFRAVRSAVKGTLDQAPWLKKILGGAHTYQAPSSSASETTSPIAPQWKESLRFAQEGFDQTFYAKPQQQQKLLGPDNQENSQTSISSEAHFSEQTASTATNLSAAQSPAPSNMSVSEPQRNESGRWQDLDILGQASLTYIVTQRRDALVVVDMHAAHERVKFETLMEAWRGSKIEVQDYLFPLSFDFSEEKVEALFAVSTDLEKLGLYLEALGPATIGVKAAPLILSEKAIGVELEKLAHELTEYGEGFSFERKIADVCATMACHSAVRAGQPLSMDQMKALLVDMDRFPLSSFCPHGRPVYVEYPFSRLERDFGRIV